MRLQLSARLLLLAGVLTAPSPCSGAAIPTRDDRVHFQSGEEPAADRPLGKSGSGTSRPQNARIDSPDGGSQGSGAPMEQAPAIVREPPANTSSGVAQQVGTSDPLDEPRPLLDVDELFALEFNRTRTTPQPATSTPVPVTAAVQPEADKDFSSQLSEVLKSILEESATRRQPTTPQPPRVDPPPQKLAQTNIDDFLPELEGALGGVLVTHRPEPRPPTTTQLPLQPTPKVPNTGEHLEHFLPTLEETIGSILKDSKIPVTTRRPAPVYPTVTIGRPSKPDAEEHVKHFLPTLEEAIAGIFKEMEVRGPPTTGRPELPPTKPATERPLSSEELKHILPALEEALGGILKESEARAPTTTARPVVPTVRPAAADDSRAQLAAVLPQLQEAIRAVLDEAVREQEAAQQRTTPTSACQPTPPATKDYGFGRFVPELERVFGDILRDRERNGAGATTTVKTPSLDATMPPAEALSFQNNAIETDSPSPQSGPLFQAVKSTLQDAFHHKGAEGKTARAQP